MMARQQGNVLAVVGAQYGSEGKGNLVAHVASRYQHHVRVGGPNAGHSIQYQRQIYKMQAIPCGWVNPTAQLYIGRGALIAPDVFVRELGMLMKIDGGICQRMNIDRLAGVISPWHHSEEGGVDGELHKRIGSTGEGVGASRIDRIKRDPKWFKFAEEAATEGGWTDCLNEDVSYQLNTAIVAGDHVLLEGTQGFGLSLIHGQWPHVTSADTNAAQMAADVGIAPRYVNRTLLVARSFPIRVAGASGPLKGEMTWDEMSRRIGKTVTEQTTVTKKTRRVGVWDEELFLEAVKVNAPTSLALTFADYINPRDEGKRTFTSLSREVREFVTYMEDISNTPVALIGTGGSQWAVVDRGLAL